MGKSLIDVLVDDVRLEEDEVALDKHRDAVVRIDHRQILGLVEHIHVDDLEIHALFVEDDAATVAEGAGSAGVEVHHDDSEP